MRSTPRAIPSVGHLRCPTEWAGKRFLTPFATDKDSPPWTNLTTMQVFCLCSLDELAPYADDWDRLAVDVPFRSWTWLSTWWRHYGQQLDSESPKARLFVLCVFDHDDALVGLAPWYLDCSGAQGHVVRMLGSGEVCSDYLSVLCHSGMEYQVTEALADYLAEAGDAENHDLRRWDLLELTGVDAQDVVIGRLLKHLADRGNTVHRQAGPSCWQIELPTTWD